MAQQTNIVFIVNPHSNGGKSKKIWSKLVPLVKEVFPQSQILLTQKPGDATSFALKSLSDPHIKKIISVGGDGTNNEVLQAFFNKGHQLRRKDCLFGLFPLGTGCDFARTLKLPKGPKHNLEIIKEGHHILSDVGHIKFIGDKNSERYFLNAFTFGITGFSAKLIHEIGYKKTKFSYFTKGIQSLFEYSPQDVNLSTNKQVLYEGPVIIVALANGQYFAAGMKLAPEADLQSGKFEAILVRKGRKRDLLKKFFSVYAGKHIDGDLVQNFKIEQLSAASQTHYVPSEYDGEEGPNLPFEALCLKQLLPLIVPHNFTDKA